MSSTKIGLSNRFGPVCPDRKRTFEMKKTAIASAALFLSVLLSAPRASACGDKLLYLSRIYRHHGLTNNTVAVFARPNSLLADVAGLKLDKVFHDEGYHLLLVDSDHDLAMALQSGAADVIIADVADVAAIQQSASTAKVPIIPVIGKDDSRSEADAKHYLAVIKSPVKSGKFLDALDRTFESKEMREKQTKIQVSSVSPR
jgi:hypothetical protein